jgi:putative PIN family toxin of toxin-antitoxin system
MKIIVLDTNCLLHCMAKKNIYHSVWEAFRSKQFFLCISNDIINEYEEVLSRKAPLPFTNMIMRVILGNNNTIFVDPRFHFNLITVDPDDNKFVDCAIAANADYIVSEDAHFQVLKTINFPKINIIRIEDFVKTLKINP